MPVGHTKFSPDWCFGLLKQRYRRCAVNCLDDMVRVVESSANVNTAQIVGDQAGETCVPTYDWYQFFQPHFKQLKNITKYHHFKFTSTAKGVVSVKHLADTEEVNISLLKNPKHCFSTVTLPDTIQPPGLSDERKVYLYEKIREFVSEEAKDIVCPRPSCLPPLLANPSNSQLDVSQTSLGSTEHPEEPPHKKARVCSKCGCTGHNRRTCNQ